MKDIIESINKRRKELRKYNDKDLDNKERKKDNRYIKSVFRKLRKGNYKVEIDGYYLSVSIYWNIGFKEVYVHFGKRAGLNWHNIDDKDTYGSYLTPNKDVRYLRENIVKFLEAIRQKENLS